MAYIIQVCKAWEKTGDRPKPIPFPNPTGPMAQVVWGAPADDAGAPFEPFEVIPEQFPEEEGPQTDKMRKPQSITVNSSSEHLNSFEAL